MERTATLKMTCCFVVLLLIGSWLPRGIEAQVCMNQPCATPSDCGCCTGLVVDKANGKHYKVLVSIFDEPLSPDYGSSLQQESSNSSSSNANLVLKWAELGSKNNDVSIDMVPDSCEGRSLIKSTSGIGVVEGEQAASNLKCSSQATDISGNLKNTSPVMNNFEQKSTETERVGMPKLEQCDP
ncbi:transcription factor E2FA-like protein [Corchorus olitorius]|uniref:Transcription factor E2FA-like protein n=1 Tax=Corchorus olitorius TaxID=93759 RepID=A0A1R3GB51_9ROSI|nr:transcription factor E2FA-like protein [Corchorus olitorius]